MLRHALPLGLTILTLFAAAASAAAAQEPPAGTLAAISNTRGPIAIGENPSGYRIVFCTQPDSVVIGNNPAGYTIRTGSFVPDIARTENALESNWLLYE